MKPPVIVSLAILLAPATAGAVSISFSGSDIESFISNLYLFGFGIGGVLAVGVIVTGGILIATSSVVNQQAKGRDMIMGAVLGLVLLFGSYLLLRTINPRLVELRTPGSQLESLPSCRGNPTEIPGVDCKPTTEIPAPPSASSTPQCSPSVFTLCTNTYRTPVTVPMTQESPFLAVNDGRVPNRYWYDQTKTIGKDQIVFSYPYYIDEEGGRGAGVPQTYRGTANAKCAVYAVRYCDGNNGELTNCPVSDIETIEINLENYLRPCHVAQ